MKESRAPYMVLVAYWESYQLLNTEDETESGEFMIKQTHHQSELEITYLSLWESHKLH